MSTSRKKRSLPSKDIDSFESPKRKKSKETVENQEPVENEDSSDSDDALDASQRPDFAYNPTMGSEAEVGIIEKVSLRNFMCHEKFDLSFGPQVNFLIGRNGSGKSAILTGIVVGLGGKATTTNRGTSIKGFIKNNKRTCVVSVKLRNRGADAYKPKEYGDSISVERRINNDGSGSYKLRNSDGQTVSTKREELNHILDQFNIQVDNPVAILNQETSRNFLNSKNAQDKYKFFLKATQLEQMKDDYITANDFKNISKEYLQQKLEHLPKLQKEVSDWEQKFKAFEAIEDLRKKIGNLKDEMAWAVVSEKEKALEPVRRELKTEELRTPKFVKHVEDSEIKVNKILQSFNDIQEQLKKMSDDIKVYQPKHNELKATKDGSKKTFKAIANEVAVLKRDLKSNENDKKVIEERINELRNSVQHNYEAQRRAREERIQQQQQQLDQLRAQLKTNEHSLEQFRLAVNRAKESQYKLKTDEQDWKKNKDQMKSQIRNLESARSNKLRRFGEHMPSIVSKIEEACRKKVFHKKPVGPLGASITLQDQNWAKAVEVCLGGLLHAFCVHNHHDERELEKIMCQVVPQNARKPTVITSAHQDKMHNVEKHRAKSTHPTVLDMIELQNLDPVVVNCLIDQRGIESILLIAESPEARKIMMRNPPKNTREAFTKNGDQLYCQTAHTTFRYYSNSKSKGPNLLQANLEDNIIALKAQLKSAESRLSTFQQQMNEVNTVIRTNNQQEKITQTQITKIRDQIVRFDFEIGELKEYEEPSAPDVTTLEDEVVRYDEQIQDIQDKLSNVDVRLQDAKADFETAEKAYSEVDKKIRAIVQNSEPTKDDLTKVENQIEKAKSDKKHYENKKKEHESKIKEMTEQLTVKEKAVEEYVTKASQFCERITTRRSAKNIESEVLQIEKRIAAEEKSRGSRDEITKKYHDTFEAFKNIKREVNQMKNFLKALDSTLKVRDAQHWVFRKTKAQQAGMHFIHMLETLNFVGKIIWKHVEEECQIITLEEVMKLRDRQYFDFRRMIAIRAKYFFIMMLNNRQYTGKIQFDHKKEILNLAVQPSKSLASKVGSTDMRSLSGGERSFSTVCFILSLWDAMESPFRMLDEFDVFMDMVNRRVSMEMMMKTASQQGGRQFIFLTPLDMSYLKQKSGIRIHQLSAPDRNQGTLDFGEGNNDEEDENGPQH